MKSGKLRHRITLQQPNHTRSETGDVTTTWSTFATPWAAVVPLAGRDFYNAKAINSDITHRVEMRYMDGVLPTMRVLHEGRVLELVSPPININERDREIHLMCRELTS